MATLQTTHADVNRGPLLDQGKGTRELFLRRFDREPFEFSHSLADRTDLFSMPAIVELARRLTASTKQRFYVESGATQPGAKWSSTGDPRGVVTVLEEIPHTNSWVVLKRIHEDAPYGELMKSLLAEVSDLLGYDLLTRYYDPLMTLLITSPGRVTPCHSDADSNLLFQLSGKKAIHIFDGDDPKLLPPEVQERFWSGDTQSFEYHENLQSRAWTYELVPGSAVHNPVIFPHWLQNADNVSISLSFNFKRIVDRKADAYKLNHQLRKLGLKPRAPGRSPALDHAKSSVYRLIRGVKRSTDSLRGKH